MKRFRSQAIIERHVICQRLSLSLEIVRRLVCLLKAFNKLLNRAVFLQGAVNCLQYVRHKMLGGARQLRSLQLEVEHIHVMR